MASFDGRSVTYGFGELDTLVPAYAATIHKSQGSGRRAERVTQTPDRCSSEVVGQDLHSAAADFAAIIDKSAFAPVTIAACLRRQQMKEGIAVAMLARVHAWRQHLLKKQRAQLFHWPD